VLKKFEKWWLEPVQKTGAEQKSFMSGNKISIQKKLKKIRPIIGAIVLDSVIFTSCSSSIP
jgi:hypothetical protein